MGAFAVRHRARWRRRAVPGDRTTYSGLWVVRPGLALAMSVFMFALLGFPVVGGCRILRQVVRAAGCAAGCAHARRRCWPCMLVLTSVVSAGYYLYVVTVMFIRRAPTSGAGAGADAGAHRRRDARRWRCSCSRRRARRRCVRAREQQRLARWLRRRRRSSAPRRGRAAERPLIRTAPPRRAADRPFHRETHDRTAGPEPRHLPSVRHPRHRRAGTSPREAAEAIGRAFAATCAERGIAARSPWAGTTGPAATRCATRSSRGLTAGGRRRGGYRRGAHAAPLLVPAQPGRGGRHPDHRLAQSARVQRLQDLSSARRRCTARRSRSSTASLGAAPAEPRRARCATSAVIDRYMDDIVERIGPLSRPLQGRVRLRQRRRRRSSRPQLFERARRRRDGAVLRERRHLSRTTIPIRPSPRTCGIIARRARDGRGTRHRVRR